MSNFADAIARFRGVVEVRHQHVFANIVAATHESIVNGSALTGAPGQPVDTGNLRDSWQVEFEGPTTALISTNVAYAQAIEDNERGVTFKNHGAHGVRLTSLGFPRIVAAEAAKAAGL